MDGCCKHGETLDSNCVSCDNEELHRTLKEIQDKSGFTAAFARGERIGLLDYLQKREADRLDLLEIRDDFQKCYDLSMRMCSHFPQEKGVWVGTVSERLTRLFDACLEKIEAEEK